MINDIKVVGRLWCDPEMIAIDTLLLMKKNLFERDLKHEEQRQKGQFQ
jgi:hypothetical protein